MISQSLILCNQFQNYLQKLFNCSGFSLMSQNLNKINNDQPLYNQEFPLFLGRMNPLFSLSQPPPNTQRIAYLEEMLLQQKKSILTFFDGLVQNLLLKNKKYRGHQDVIKEKLQKSTNFVRNITEIFFEMISDHQYLVMTPEIDLSEKVAKYKKNLQCAWQRLVLGFDQEIQLVENCQGRQNLSNPHFELREQQQEGDEQMEEEYMSEEKPYKKIQVKGKNCKISNDAALSMMKWLLNNFENPYPTTEQKQAMAKEGGISLSKVNNWFINARERTVKSYFSKGKQ